MQTVTHAGHVRPSQSDRLASIRETDRYALSHLLPVDERFTRPSYPVPRITLMRKGTRFEAPTEIARDVLTLTPNTTAVLGPFPPRHLGATPRTVREGSRFLRNLDTRIALADDIVENDICWWADRITRAIKADNPCLADIIEEPEAPVVTHEARETLVKVYHSATELVIADDGTWSTRPYVTYEEAEVVRHKPLDITTLDDAAHGYSRSLTAEERAYDADDPYEKTYVDAMPSDPADRFGEGHRVFYADDLPHGLRVCDVRIDREIATLELLIAIENPMAEPELDHDLFDIV